MLRLFVNGKHPVESFTTVQNRFCAWRDSCLAWFMLALAFLLVRRNARDYERAV